MMLAEKLQHLIVKLSQKMMGANVLGKCKKSKMRGEREVVVVENDYQRTELPAKADGQWILFRQQCGQYCSCAQCPACIFGDPSLTCTCNFRSDSPDFKLYEDEDLFASTEDQLDQTVWI